MSDLFENANATGAKPTEGSSQNNAGVSDVTTGSSVTSDKGSNGLGEVNSSGDSANQQKYSITVDGKTMEVELDDLIARAQKGMAAEKRFEEAARIRKEAELYQQAVNELKEIVTKKDYNKFKEIVGEEFFSGLSGTGKASGKGTESDYSVEDMRAADLLGVDINTYIEAKMKAQGIDNPMVAKQAQEINTLKEQLKKVNDYMRSVKIENDAARIESHFRSVAEKYPEVDPNRVLDIVEREKRPASDFETIFKTLDEMEKKKFEEKFNKYAEEKKKAAMSNFGGVNYSNEGTDKKLFEGKSLSQRKELLKGIFKN